MTQPSLIETFNTHNLTDEKVRALMTARDRERDAVMAAVRANLARTRGQIQHVALYGPRGFGKSFLARVIELEVAAEAAAGAEVAYLLLPEEQHNLARSPDALLRYFENKLRNERDAWQAAAFTWPTGEASERWREAEASLEAAIDAHFGEAHGLLIVVVENFDLLIRDVFAEGGAEERLRKWLTRRNNRVMLFVTATGHVDLDYERPLFQAFLPVHLSGWSEDDCLAYFNRRRALTGGPPLDEPTRAKARAIASFIGGNPRLAQLLSDVLETNDALSVAELLNALADELADYYRRRVDDLPPLSRGLLDALIRGGEPCSATALAKRVRTDQNIIARPFNVLTKTDIVAGRQASDSKEKLFSVRDRVFVHFYRVRYGGVARDASPLVHIVEFLEMFYRTPDERRAQAVRYLERGLHREAKVFLDLPGTRSGGGAFGFGGTFRYRLATYLRVFPNALPQGAEELATLLTEHPEQLYTEARKAAPVAVTPEARVLWRIIHAHAAVRMGLADAKPTLQSAHKNAGARDDLAFVVESELGLFVYHVIGDKDDAAQGALIAPERLRQPLLRCIAFRDRAWALEHRGAFQEAIDAAGQAAKLAQAAGDRWQQAVATRHCAWSLGQLGRHEEAITAAAQAAALAQAAGDRREQAVAIRHCAWSLGQLGRHEEAITAAAQAAALAQAAGDRREQARATRHRAWSLSQLGRHQDAVEEAERSIELAREAHDRATLEWSLCTYLQVVAPSGSARAVEVLGELLASSSEQYPGRRPTPWLYLDDVTKAVTRSRDWARFLALVEQEAAWFAQRLSWSELDGTTEAVVAIGREQGRMHAFEATSALFDALPKFAALMAQARSDAPSFPKMSSWFVRHLAARQDDPGLLRDIAGLLDERLGADATEDLRFLRDLATFHEAGRAPSALERIDPDRTTLIRVLWNVAEPDASR